jgi:hypothetical protein
MSDLPYSGSGLPYGGSGLPYGGEKEPYTPRKKRKADGGALLMDRYPTHYMPHVGRQVMADGGAPEYDGPTLPIPTRLPTWDDAKHAVDVAKSFLTPADPYQEAGKAVEQYRAGNPVDAFATMAGAMPQTGAIKAYHGSPHKFDRFDISKIGTGEGAQAYGHGLYFADNEGVARSYRDQLSGMNWHRDTMGDSKTLKYLQDNFLKKPLENNEKDLEWAQSIVDDIKNKRPSGHMYEVAIHADPEHFLDWDKPLREQPSVSSKVGNGVMRQLADLGESKRSGWGDLGIGSNPDEYISGQDLYRHLTPGFVSSGPYREPNAAAAAETLRAAGIPGIRYLDQGSRGAGDGSRNYVLFDDKPIEILRRYADGGEVGPSAAITGPHTITADDLIGRAVSTAQNVGAYTDTGGQKIAAPYVIGMKDGYPVYSIPAEPATTPAAKKDTLPYGFAEGGGVDPVGKVLDMLAAGGTKAYLSASQWPDAIKSTVEQPMRDVVYAGDVATGKRLYDQDEAIQAAVRLAGNVGTGGMAMGDAPAGAIGINAGVRAKNAPMSELGRAVEMALSDGAPGNIYRETGWWPGADTQWRHRISDVNSSLTEKALNEIRKPAGAVGKLDELFSHPELYEAYPHLRDIGANLASDPSSQIYGQYLPTSKFLVASSPVFKDNPNSLRAIILHELQHAVQQHEGFSPGAHPDVVGVENYLRSAGENEARYAQFGRNIPNEHTRAIPDLYPWMPQNAPEGLHPALKLHPYSEQIVQSPD